MSCESLAAYWFYRMSNFSIFAMMFNLDRCTQPYCRVPIRADINVYICVCTPRFFWLLGNWNSCIGFELVWCSILESDFCHNFFSYWWMAVCMSWCVFSVLVLHDLDARFWWETVFSFLILIQVISWELKWLKTIMVWAIHFLDEPWIIIIIWSWCVCTYTNTYFSDV